MHAPCDPAPALLNSTPRRNENVSITTCQGPLLAAYSYQTEIIPMSFRRMAIQTVVHLYTESHMIIKEEPPNEMHGIIWVDSKGVMLLKSVPVPTLGQNKPG